METFSFGLKNNITRDFKARLEEIFDDMVRYGDRYDLLQSIHNHIC